MASKTQGPSASLRASAGTPQLPDDYPELVARLKHEIAAGRTRAALAVNEELIQLYRRIGSDPRRRTHTQRACGACRRGIAC